VVLKNDVYEATEGTTLGRRVGKLCNAFYKDEVHRHFLSGKCQRAPQDMKLFKIDDIEVKAMKRMYHRGIYVIDINAAHIRLNCKCLTFVNCRSVEAYVLGECPRRQ
jgi:hypothetical protein